MIKMSETRNCPECGKYLKKFPVLRQKDIMKQCRTKESWIHITPNGKTLHNCASHQSGLA
jgi:hypothetical protein